MTCKGVLPDGGQCDAPDQYVSTETGFCWVCAAPESKALMPGGSTDLMVDPEMEALYESSGFEIDASLPEKCQAFLRAYVEAEGEWTLVGAAAVLGIHRNTHDYWKRKVPGYAEAYEKAKVEVQVPVAAPLRQESKGRA